MELREKKNPEWDQMDFNLTLVLLNGRFCDTKITGDVHCKSRKRRKLLRRGMSLQVTLKTCLLQV